MVVVPFRNNILQKIYSIFSNTTLWQRYINDLMMQKIHQATANNGFAVGGCYCVNFKTSEEKKMGTKTKFDAASNLVYPMPVVVLGSMLDGKPNFMPHGWIVRANYAPPIIAIGLGKIPKPHHTNLAIDQSKTFSVNYPSVDLIKKVDYCGTVSGENVDKSKVFDIFYGELKTAPMIKDCSVTMECKVINVVDMESSTMYFGSVEGAYSEESVMTDGNIDIKKLVVVFS
jgi:flavin reductase (DIM6/NTAB) family NADH-FMN oxidoreductase RutF